MGSLNTDGTPITQGNNTRVIRHHGDFLVESTTEDDTRITNISASGVIRTGFSSTGIAWQPGGTATTSGLSLAERTADDSVEREKFTHNFAPDGNLQQHVTRAKGIHTSVSDRQGIVAASGLIGGDTLGPLQTVTERKVFFLDTDRETLPANGWRIYDQLGNAVGPAAGTTETDITANSGLLGL
jgi:hypothetical protein